MGLFKRIKKRKQSQKANTNSNVPYMMEILEPRIMLSADLTTTNVALVLSNGIGQFDSQVDNFIDVGEHPALETRLPLVIRNEGTDILDYHSVAPKIMEILSVDVDINGDGHEGVNPDVTLPSWLTDAETELDGLDTSADGKVDFLEFLQGGFFGEISPYLDGTKTKTEFENALEGLDISAGLQNGQAYTVESVDFYAPARWIELVVTSSDTSDDNQVSFEMDVSLKFRNELALDLGTKAEDYGITLPGLYLDVDATLEFTIEVGVLTSGETPTSDDFFLDFIQPPTQDDITLTIDGSTTFTTPADVDIGFLGVEVKTGGSVTLTANLSGDIADPTTPTTLGFSTSQFGDTSATGTITADAVPSAYDLTDDAEFILRIGNSDARTVTVGDVLTNGNTTIAELVTDVSTAVGNAGLGSVITVDSTVVPVTGRLILSVVDFDATAFGFSSNEQSGTTLAGTNPVTSPSGNMSFIISVDHDIPVVISVSGVTSLADLKTKLDTALSSSGTGVTATWTGGGANEYLELTTASSKHLEISDNLTFNSTLSHSDLGASVSDLMPTFNTSGTFGVNLPIQIKSGMSGFTLPSSAAISLTSSSYDPFVVTPLPADADGNIRFNFDVDIINVSLAQEADVFNFVNISASDVVGLVRRFGSWLDQARQTDSFSSIELPLSGADLSDFLDFENIVDDMLLTAGQLITDNNDPNFSTAQELAAKLGAASYNTSTEELTYSVNLTHALDPLSVPIDFNLDFSPLLNISSNSEVQLTADGTLMATFGFFLGDLGGATLTDSTTLDSLGIDMDEIEAGPSITAVNAPRIIYGRLTTDAHFGLLIDGYTANQHTFDGASGVDDSTDKITVTSHGMSTGDVVIYSKGADVNTAVGGLLDNGTYFVIYDGTNTVKLAMNAEDAAAGVAIDLTDGTNADHFLLEAVTVPYSETKGNITMTDLVTDINAALLTAGLNTHILAESPTTAHRVALKDISAGGFTLYATSTDSAVRELGFTPIQDAVLGGIPSAVRVIGTKDVPRRVGRLTGDTTFEIIIGSTNYTVTIEAGETVIVKDGKEFDGNRTIIDLINDLEKAIETPSLVSGAVGVNQLTGDAHFDISINSGTAIEVTVEAALTDGSLSAHAAFNGSSDVNIAEDTITFSSPHNFITGDEVDYTDGGGTQIEGLTDGGTYYVIVEDSTTIKLAESEDDANSDLAIVLLAVGAGADHRLTHTANADFEDLIDDINRAISATTLSGLIKAEHYKWTDPSTLVTTDHIRLKAVDESVVNFGLTAAGGDPAVTVLGLPTGTHLYRNLSDTIEVMSQGDHLVLRANSDELAFDGATDVNLGADTITIENHGLLTGRAVKYSAEGGTAITGTGLNEVDTFYIIVVDSDTVKLATSESNAFAGTQIDLTGVGSSGDHQLIAPSFDIDGSSASELGFGASQSADYDDLIIRLSNNTSPTVSLDGATTIIDVIDKIHEATGGTFNGGTGHWDAGNVLVEIDPDEGTGLRLKDNTFPVTPLPSTPIFRVEPTNASPAAIQLGILAMDPGGDLNDDGYVNAVDGDSYIDGGPLTGADLANRFYIESGQLSASFALDTPSINFSSLDTHASDHKKVVHTDFDPIHIGMYIDITGTGFTAGRYKIVDVQGNEAELDDDAWTSASTSGTGTILGIQASASFGFVGIDLIGSGSLTGTVSAGLNGGSRIYLSDLVADLGAAADFVDTPTFSGLGSFVLDVIVRPDFLSLLSSGTPQITINVNSIGDAFTITEFSSTSTPAPTWVDADTFSLTGDYTSTFKKGLVVDIDIDSSVVSAEILGSTYDTGTLLTTVDLVSGVLSGGSIVKVFAPIPPDISLTFADLDDLVDFDDIGFSNILDAISDLVDFLSGIEGLEFFDLEIPLIGKSVNDLLSLADKFTTALDEITSDPAGTIQLVETKLKNALGLPISSPSILSLDGGLLKFELDLVASFNESLGVELPEFLDLGDLGLGLSGSIGLGGSADLNANGSLTASLDFGIDLGVLDLEDLGDIYIYDTTGVDAEINASGENLSFWASLGPFGLFIQNHPDYDSEISINGTFSAGVKDSAQGGNKALISSVLFDTDNFDTTITGTVGGTLPVFFPIDSAYVGNITITDESLASPGNLADISRFEFLTTASEVADIIANPDSSTWNGTENSIVLNAADVIQGIKDFDFTNQFNLFDNILLAVDGIDMFLEGLQYLLDTEIFSGLSLPVIGNPFTEGADFIEDFREDFVEPLRKLIEDVENAAKDVAKADKNLISKYMFDLLDNIGLLQSIDSTRATALEAHTDFQGYYLDASTPYDNPDNKKIGLTTNFGDYLDGVGGVTFDETFIQWDLAIGGEYEFGKDFDFDIGIPGLGLEADGDVSLKIGWDLDIGFGISFKDGFYFNIADQNELTAHLIVEMDETTITGTLGFLQLTADVNEADLGLAFEVNIKEKGESETSDDGKMLTFTELGKIDIGFGIAAEALIDLNLELGLSADVVGSGAASGFPKVSADFILDWGIYEDPPGFDSENPEDSGFVTITELGNQLQNSLKYVGFQNITLDLGSFVSDVLGPIVGEVQDITEPIQPLIDFITTPFPVLSDFGLNITPLDLAAAYGQIDPGLIYAIADIITLINKIPDPDDVGSLKIPILDNLAFYDDGTSVYGNGPSNSFLDLGGPEGLWSSDFDLSGAFDTVTDKVKAIFGSFLPDWLGDTLGDLAGEAADIMKDVTGEAADTNPWKFPIIEDPMQVLGLFMGRPAVLVTYDMAPLEFEFEYSQFFPIWGPLGVSINVEFGATIDFAFGYDTLGIQEFVESGFRNPLLLFDGFYVSDTDLATGDFGTDVPELKLTGGLWAAAEINLGIARAGVGGGVFIEIDFDLFDPDRDGRVRIKEILGNIYNEWEYGVPLLAPLAIFDVHGEITAKLFAFLKIDLFLFSIDKRWDITPEVTILEFDIPFTRPPILATELKDGDLQINAGPYAAQRLNGNINDISEHFVVRQSGSKVEVKAPGLWNEWQEYEISPTDGTIVFKGGEGDDTFEVEGTMPASTSFEIDGGVGNDVITLSASPGATGPAVIMGSEGDDVIHGSDGDDIIYGLKGNDTIYGGGGNDIIFGDDGRIGSESITAFFTPTEDGNDIIYGEGGDDIIFGSGGADAIYGDDETTVSGGSDKDIIIGDGGKLEYTGSEAKTVGNVDEIKGTQRDKLDPKGGDDLLIGGADTDIIYGGTGNDIIDGGAGNDELYGEEGYDTIYGGSDVDHIYGGEGGDTIFGERDGSVTATGNPEPWDELWDETDTPLTVAGDFIYGEAGRDIIYGDTNVDDGVATGGADEIYGGDGYDKIDGDAGGDEIYGEGGPDTIYGGTGADTIDGGDGADVVFGDRGLDDLTDQAKTFDGAADVDPSTDIITISGNHGFLPGQTVKYTAGGGTEIDGLDEGETYYVIKLSDTTLKLAASKLDANKGIAVDITADGSGSEHKLTGVWNPKVYGTNTANEYDYLFGSTKSNDTPGGEDPGDLIYSGSGSDFLDGQAGNDTYVIYLEGAANNGIINLHDSRDESTETDYLQVFGTMYDDEFLLRKSSSLSGASFVALINDEPYVERINYWGAGAVAGLGLERMLVTGSFGDDYFAVDDVGVDATLTGDVGEDRFQVGQLYNSPRDECAYQYNHIETEDVFATIETTVGWLSDGINRPMTIYGGENNDYFTVFHNKAVLSLFGEDGDDTFLIKAFALAGSQEPVRERTDVSGGAGVDLVQYAMNAPVNIDGGDGFDRVIIIGTEFGDDFVVTKDGVFGAGLNVSFVNIESLSVDGAEGDDRFYVLSTGEDLITELFGGLGSDTFNMSGPTPPIISNDLRGHSGVITHDIENVGTNYNETLLLGDETIIGGISAHVSDNDTAEPVIVISEPDGETVITEGDIIGAGDSYWIVLSKSPATGEVVTVQVMAPVQTQDQQERKSRMFQLSSPSEFDPTTDRTSISLKFDELNWYIPQEVEVSAPDDSDPLDNDTKIMGYLDPDDHDDDAIEGDKTGYITHMLTSSIAAVTGSPSSEPTVTEQPDGSKVTTFVDMFALYTSSLVGYMLQITDGPGAGQSLRIKEVVGLHTLKLFGEFRGCEAAQVGPTSMYKITRDIEAVRAIEVLVHDNDIADVDLVESDHSTEIFEDGADDTIDIVLARQPDDESGTVDDVTVTLASNDGQLTFTGTTLVGGDLTFSAVGSDSNAWNNPQTVTVSAFDDSVREGFHHGLISFTLSSDDVNDDVSVTEEPALNMTQAYVGLLNRPVIAAKGMVTSASAEGTFVLTDTNASFSGVGGYLVQITDGAGKGQTRSIASSTATALTVTKAWDEALDDTSQYEVVGVTEVRIGGLTRHVDLYQVVSNKVVFINEDGEYEFIASGTIVQVDYKYVDRGYNLLDVKPKLTDIADNDVPQVKITETGDGTDIIEDGWHIGKVTSWTSDTLTDTSASFVGSLSGLHVQITEGAGKGQVRTIDSNTPIKLTVTEPWDTSLVTAGDNASEYAVIWPANIYFPFYDSYEVVLTQEPTDDVEVLVTPEITKTSAGRIIHWGKQVGVISYHPEAVDNGDGTITLKFTDSNWSSPQTVYVIAVDDAHYDGDDTQVFAPQPHTVSDIQGPLYLYGAGGYGSIVAFKPLMLDHELNIMPSTGDVDSVGVDGTTITVAKDPLFDGAKEINKTIRDLIDDSADDADVIAAIVTEMMTVTISEGIVGTEPDGDPIYIEEIGQFRLIVDAVDNGNDTVTLTLNEAWDLVDSETFDMITKYRITHMSANFFADETEQIDYLFVYNNDSPADNEIPSREGWLTDSTTIGYADNSIVESFVINQDGKWLRGLGMAAEDLMLGGVMHPRGITYGDMEVVEINLGDGRDHFTVEDTHIRADGFQTWTIINTGDEPVGDYNEDGIVDGDLIAVSLHADDVLDLHTGTVTDADANSLTDTGGAFPLTANEKGLSGYIVEITGGTGVGQRRVIVTNTATELTIDEAWGVTPDTTSEYRVFGAELLTGTATGDSAPTEKTLNGDFSAFSVNELQGKVIEIIDGSGAGTKREIIANTTTQLTVSSTWNASLDTTTVYRVYGDQDGPVSINTQGGADRLFAAGSYYDEIDDATVVLEDSTLPLIIFGGAGDDEIVGGLADDIIFGDRGRVDFVDENFVDGNGKIVTMLGLVREVIDPEYVTAATDTTLTDTAAVFPVESIDALGLIGLMVSITDGAGFRQDPRLIISNTSDTLTIAPAWETALNPDPAGPFDPSDPDNNPSKYRISLIPEDQTDGVVRDPSRLIAIDETIGGNDVITGNDGNDRIFGGLGDDEIQGNDGNDVIFGDHGRMDYEPEIVGDVEDGPALGDSVPATLERIRTTFDAIGGSDTITGDAGDDIILGGYDEPGTDILDGNTDDDILIGDNGVMAFVPNDDTPEDPRDVYLDDVNTLSHGIGGTDIISGNAGYDIAIGGTDGDTIYGDDAAASAGALDGEDIIIGDNGHIDFTPGVTGRFNAFGGGVNLIETTDVLNTTGGGDTIEGNAQADVILGGVNDGEIDEIYGDAAVPGVNDDDDVILGDNGKLDFADGDSNITTLDILRSLPYDDPNTPSVILGGVDSISGDAGNDTIIGGVGGDTIYGDDVAANNGPADGKDVLIGDNGEIFLSGDVLATLYALDSGINLIQTTDDEEATGGGDFIEGNADNDVILGGVNDGEVDVLHGDAAAPGIHDGDDIIIGDNGEVDYDVDGVGLTTLDLITTNTYASDGTTVLGGRDRIFGNAYHDVALGGSADDDIIGDNYETDPLGAPGVVDGLYDSPGDDTIIGDQGHVVYVNGLVTLIETLDLLETDGGSDYVQGNDMEDIILGGVEGDILIGESETTDRVETPGDDIIIGDEGRLRYDVALSEGIYGAGDEDPNTLDLIETFDTGILGGNDIIYGNEESDIVMGGSADDDIFGDFYAELNANGEVIPGTLDAAPIPGTDVLIGDGGQMTFFDNVVTVIRTIEPSMGGSDHIEGHDFSDKILGGVDDDELYGESPETDLPLILSGAGDDWMLGDNGQFDYVLDSDTIEDRHDVADHLGGTLVELDPDSSNLDIVTTTDVNDGGNDVMYGNGGNDVMFGGTATDTMRGDTTDNEADSNPDGTDGIDLMFGDHAKIFPTLPTVDDFFFNNNFFSINTQVEDDGFDDIMFGNGNDDIMIGGQGDDIMFGGNGDDDMIGGFNVANGDDELDDMPAEDILAISPDVLADLNAADVNEINDIMDGGADDDVMTGDNAYIIRQPGGNQHDPLLSPRFRMLGASGLLYEIDSEMVGGLADIDVGFHANVTGDYRPHQDMTLVRTVYLYNHDEATEDAAVANPDVPRPFGNDVIAGGTQDDEIWGQLGDDIIQGDGQILMLAGEEKPAEFMEFSPAQDAIPDFDIRETDVLVTLASGVDTTFRFSAFEDEGDGDDYIEGNGGNDRIYGGLGQDDLIGGSSILFGLYGDDPMRPDGADLIYGGAGNPVQLSRNASFTGPDNDISSDASVAVPTEERHARDADVILGDNGEIYRIVTAEESYESFNYDYDATSANGFVDDGYDGDALRIIPRAVDLNDYGYSYADTDSDSSTRDVLTFTDDVRGEGDLIYGESGDDVIHGMTGNDAIFGNSEHDDIFGEIGNDFLLGGTGIDGILGDDGLILTRRNDLNAESLYGIDPRDPEQVKVKNNEEVNTNALNAEISTPGNIQRAIINIEGELVKVLETFVFRTDDLDGQIVGEFDDSMRFNDIIFGGLDNDFIHGIDGDDAISGAEALPVYYSGDPYGFEAVNTFLQNMQSAPPNGTPDLADNPFWFGFAPYNPGEILRYEGKTIIDGTGQNPKTRDEFAWYDEFNPRRKIMFDFDYDFGTLPENFAPLATETGVANVIDFLLNFEETEGPDGYPFVDDGVAMATDGNDRIFGDVGHDWLVGGTGRDNMYGGRGNDLINMDDNHDSGPGGRVGPHDPLPDPLDNTQSDEYQAYADIVYSGAGRDVMILNTGADRAIDWVGEFNSYIVPFSPFGAFHISRNLSPHVPEYLQALSASDGADVRVDPGKLNNVPDAQLYVDQKNIDVRIDEPDPLRNYEPYGELGMVKQQDLDWGEQTGAPNDPQPGNLQGKRDIMRRELFQDTVAPKGAFAETEGIWTASDGKLEAAPVILGEDAVSIYHLDKIQPSYMEILVTINAEKDKAGFKSNAYIIFDYKSSTDFKFAGIDVGIDKIQIGHYTTEGWIVDSQIPMQLKADIDYDLTLVMYGTVATIWVDGKASLSFDFNDVLNDDGLIGLATNNAVARFDDWQVQKLPPTLTFQFTEDFAGTSTNPFKEQIGNWMITDGHYSGSVVDGDRAITTWALEVATWSLLEFEALIDTGTTGGLIFDYYDADNFKFAAIDALNDQVVIGHHTSKGWFIDASAERAIEPGTGYRLGISMLGTSVSVTLDGEAVLGHVFNGLLNDGYLGLLSKDGASSFDDVVAQGDDPAYAEESGDALKAAGLGAATDITDLNHTELAPIIDAAIDYWIDIDGVDASRLADVSFLITDLSDTFLGVTVGNTILIDTDAAGYGWFVDETPYDNIEFSYDGGNGELTAALNSEAEDNMDLLTVVRHELGHVLGLEDVDSQQQDLMSDTLATGVRHVYAEAAITSLPLNGSILRHYSFFNLLSDDLYWSAIHDGQLI